MNYSPRYSLFFKGLSVVAVLLLWGISFLNGTVSALFAAVWTGSLGESGPLVVNYTGVPIVDYPIALLVAFFFKGTDGSNEAYQLFLFDAYSTLQTAFVWLNIESIRAGARSAWLKRPVVFGLLWQCFGGAISLPLYYALHCSGTLDRGRPVSENQLAQARAVPVSYIVGAVLPAVIGMAPTWLGPQVRPSRQHQLILALWQPDPLWVSFVQMVAAKAMSSWRLRRGADAKRSVQWWIRLSYLLSAGLSALGHLYVGVRILLSQYEETNIWRMYVPFPSFFRGPDGVSDIFTRGPWLFLQYDLIIIGLSSLIWAYRCLSVPDGRFNAKLAIGLLFGALSIGPGATVSMALYVREKSFS